MVPAIGRTTVFVLRLDRLVVGQIVETGSNHKHRPATSRIGAVAGLFADLAPGRHRRDDASPSAAGQRFASPIGRVTRSAGASSRRGLAIVDAAESGRYSFSATNKRVGLTNSSCAAINSISREAASWVLARTPKIDDAARPSASPSDPECS